MTQENDGWIKMSDRHPTDCDFPVFCYGPHCGMPHKIYSSLAEINNPGELTTGVTHWRPCVIPALPVPPKKEPTQQEDDNEAYQEYCGSPNSYWQSIWHAALAYRDAQNREDLKHVVALGFDKSENQECGLIKRLRRRCGLEE